MQPEPPAVLMIMLCLRCMVGGAEKRYARIFKMLAATQPRAGHKLLINRAMFELLQNAGIFCPDDAANIIVLNSPFSRRSQTKAHWLLTPLEALWYAWQCGRVIWQTNPAIVHPLLTGMYLSLPALMLRPKIKHVMSAYAIHFKPDRYTHSSLGVKIGLALKRCAMQRCHAIDALSESIQRDLVAYGLDSRKIRVAPCSFTDISLCQPATQRKKWVVFLARFIEYKNPLLLARAIPHIVATEPDVHFYFLGWGELQSQLEATLAALSVADYVSIQFEAQPARILSQSAIFVSLQPEENYPSQSLLEAMACGNAIVATDVGETWRLVDDSNGLRIPPTPEAVARAVITLLQDPLLPQRGLASRQRILLEYTPERFLTYINHLYQSAFTGESD